MKPVDESDLALVKADTGVTYDILFLAFVLASKRYILLRKVDPSVCRVPEEFTDITKGLPAVPSGLAAPAVAAPAVPAAAARVAAAPAAAAPVPAPVPARAPAPEPKCVRVNIRRMDKGVTANVIILSEDHPTIFEADPYCFVQDGMPLP